MYEIEPAQPLKNNPLSINFFDTNSQDKSVNNLYFICKHCVNIDNIVSS